jgi:hypothetical protein
LVQDGIPVAFGAHGLELIVGLDSSQQSGGVLVAAFDLDEANRLHHFETPAVGLDGHYVVVELHLVLVYPGVQSLLSYEKMPCHIRTLSNSAIFKLNSPPYFGASQDPIRRFIILIPGA